MSELVKSANPGLNVTYSTGGMEATVGDDLRIDMGIKNEAIVGGWNRLFVCASVIIQVGARMEVILANSVKAVKGDVWNYVRSNQSSADVDQRYGVHRYLVAGGAHLSERKIRWDERKQAKSILFGSLIVFAAAIGATLVNIKNPLFEIIPQTKPANKENEAAEDLSGNNTSSTVNFAEIASTLLTGLWVIFTLYSQYTLAKKMADNLKDFNAVANLSLATNGLTSAVFADPLRQPKLVLANDPENTKGADYYELLPDEFVAEYVAGELVHRPAVTEDSGSSPAAVFNMLPGMPDHQLLTSYDMKDSPYHNWENPKEGKYPDHDKKPVITVSSHLEPDKHTSSALDILPDSAILVSRVGMIKKDKLNKVIECPSSASINLVGNDKNRQIIMESTDKDKHGGIFLIDDERTLISRNSGKAIELSFIGKNTSSEEPSAASSNEEIETEINSLLHLSKGRASLSAKDGNTGIYVLGDSVEILSDGKIVASFCVTKSNVMGKQFGATDKSSQEGNGAISISRELTLPQSPHNSTKSTDISELLAEKIQAVKSRIAKMEDHKEKTGGFSGTMGDEAKKNWRLF
jgi:hypothetical protein